MKSNFRPTKPFPYSQQARFQNGFFSEEDNSHLLIGDLMLLIVGKADNILTGTETD